MSNAEQDQRAAVDMAVAAIRREWRSVEYAVELIERHATGMKLGRCRELRQFLQVIEAAKKKLEALRAKVDVDGRPRS